MELGVIAVVLVGTVLEVGPEWAEALGGMAGVGAGA